MTTTKKARKKKKENAADLDDNAAADLDAAAEAFALSPSAALGLDRTGAAADASRGPRVDHLVISEGEEEGEKEGEGEKSKGEEEEEEEEREDLAAFVARRSALSREHAVALLELGAVWWCPVPPPPPRLYSNNNSSESTPAAVAAAEARAAAEERHRSGRERHGKGMHLFKPRRAAAAEGRPPAGSYVRVHVRPKRYFDLRADAEEYCDDAEKEEEEEEEEEEEGKSSNTLLLPTSLAKVGYGARAWARRLVALSPEFAILNKPPCVPSVPTVDNGLEHALSGAAAGIAEVLRVRTEREEKEEEKVGEDEEAQLGPQQLQRRRRRCPPNRGPQASGEAATGGLAAAHRLDHGASGVLAIGRTPRFVAGFQELSKRGRVAKVYRAALRASSSDADAADDDAAAAETTAAAAETNAPSSSSSFSSASPKRRCSLPRPGDTLVHWAEVNARPHGAPPRTLMFDGPGESAGGGGGGEEGGEGNNTKKERARCELRIVSMKRVSLLPSAAEALGVSSAGEQVWEACILLITGRTHQVREEREGERWKVFFFQYRRRRLLKKKLKKN